MVLFILRGLFILLVAAVITLYVAFHEFQQRVEIGVTGVMSIIVGTVAIAGVVVLIDVATRKKKLSAVSGIFLGLIAGLLAAYALSFVVDLIGAITAPQDGAKREAFFNLLRGVKVIIGIVTCYLGISLVLQTKDDFRFVIPYVEFAKQIRGQRPTLLDTSVVIDGRILDILNTRLLQGVLVIPKFVLNELQQVADSSDKLRRARGRRGLEILQKLQETPYADVIIEETDAEGGNVDQKLVSLAKDTNARIMTNDFNLNKIATLRGVDVINLNDLAKAMRPVVLPGEMLTVKIVKPGESPTQGVGYLEDGTMVVVENARQMIGEETDLVVTSTIQTSAGRMIFGRLSHDASGEFRAIEGHATDSHSGGSAAESQATRSQSSDAHTPLGPGAGRSPRSGHSGRNPRRH